jgi:membrane glycosyltransferase
MFESWEPQDRIAEAKRLTTCVVNHLQYLLDIHENNAIVLYSDTLSKQIPKSIAANAFNVVREAMHQIEIVRIAALWDNPQTIERESILIVIELIDDPKVLDALADQARADYPPPVANQRAERALSSLKDAIKKARQTRSSDTLKSIRNLRDKHVAHYLTEKAEETTNDIAPMKHGDEVPVIETSISIVEALNSYVNDVGMSFEAARAIDRKCAAALWQKCTFKIDT